MTAKVRTLMVVVVLVSMSAAQAAPGTSAKKPARRSSAVTAEDIRSLREAVEAQQKQIEELRQMVLRSEQQRQETAQKLADAQAAAQQAREQAAAAQAGVEEQKQSTAAFSSSLADVQTTLTNSAVNTQDEQKKFSSLEGLVNRFRFSGDVRVRYENFLQDGVTSRHRERIRLRLGVQGKINEDFLGGIFLASGTWSNGNPSLADPVSTNETLTGYFERKAVGFDRGWITYNPRAHKWLSLTGGKFAYTWDRTVMTFDGDLNPEGFVQKLSFDLPNPVFKNVTVNGMQLMFNEVSGGIDSFAAGAAFSTKLQLGERVTITPSYSILNWRNEDVIAQAAKPATPLVGSAAARVINANPMTNATRNCGEVKPPATPHPECRIGADGTGAAHTEFVSGFLYSDFIVNTSIKTPWKRWPITLVAEYLKNLDAENESPTAVGKQDTAYWLEASIGQQKDKNDVLLGYSFGHVEQDALIGQFADSDFRSQTNMIQHRLYGNWRVQKNVTAAYTLYVGRTLNCALQNAALVSGFTCGVTAPTEPLLKRMQFDLIYAF